MDPITSTALSVAISEIFNFAKEKHREASIERELINEALDKTAKKFDCSAFKLEEAFEIDESSKLVQKYRESGEAPDLSEWCAIVNEDCLQKRGIHFPYSFVATFVESFEEVTIMKPNYKGLIQISYYREIEQKLDEIYNELDSQNSSIQKPSKLEHQRGYEDDLLYTQGQISYWTRYEETAGNYKPYVGVDGEVMRGSEWTPEAEEHFTQVFDEEYRERIDRAFDRHSEELIQFAEDMLGMANYTPGDFPLTIGYIAKIKFKDVWEILSSEPVSVRANSYLYLGIKTMDRLD